MKSIFLLSMMFVSVTANAMPELYCVSARNYGAMTQVSLFTNAKGTLRMSAEMTSQEGYLANTDNLLTLQRLKFDQSTQSISNGDESVKLVLSKEISRAQAYDLYSKFTDENGTYPMGSGLKIEFSKLRLATMVNFKVPAKRNSWQAILNQAFKAGVTQYICGDARDAVRN